MSELYAPPRADDRDDKSVSVRIWRVCGWVEVSISVVMLAIVVFALAQPGKYPLPTNPVPSSPGAFMFGLVLGIGAVPVGVGLLGFTAIRGMRWPHLVVALLGLVAAGWALAGA